jgi:hypothetical protein
MSDGKHKTIRREGLIEVEQVIARGVFDKHTKTNIDYHDTTWWSYLKDYYGYSKRY